MNREERIKAHQMPGVWKVNPKAHLSNRRDLMHFEYAKAKTSGSVFDLGPWDGWLDFLLIEEGRTVSSCELSDQPFESGQAYAKEHGIDYPVEHCFFDDYQAKDDSFDCCIAFEVLEHVTHDVAKAYLAKLVRMARQRVLISLPLQDMKDNPQHLWSPDAHSIDALFRGYPYSVSLVKYPNTDIPPNFFIEVRA